MIKNSSIIQEDDESLVNCLESLDKDDISILRQSIRIEKKKPEKPTKNHDEIEEIPEDFQEIREEIAENFDKDVIEEEIIAINPPQKYEKPLQIKDSSTNRCIKVIKARPISANIKPFPNENSSTESKFLLNKGFSLVKLEKNDKNLVNPFQSLNRPKTEFSTKRKNLITSSETGEFQEKVDILEKNDKFIKESPSKSKGLEQILKKIEQLDEEKKQELELFLERIIDGKLDIKSLLKFDFLPEKPQKTQLSNKIEILAKKPTNEQVCIEKPKEIKQIFVPEGKELLRIRVISSWNGANLAGLTEIQLFNGQGEQIKLFSNEIQVKNSSFSNAKCLKNLINGQFCTTEQENMWLAALPESPETLEIQIFFPENCDLAAIFIWNYNKSLIDSGKGVKEIEVFLRNQLVWNGVVRKGIGNELENYGEFIKIKHNFDEKLIKFSQFEKKINELDKKKDDFVKKTDVIVDCVKNNDEFVKKNDEILSKNDDFQMKSNDIPIKNNENQKKIDDSPKKKDDFAESLTNLSRKSVSRAHPKTVNLFEELENSENKKKQGKIAEKSGKIPLEANIAEKTSVENPEKNSAIQIQEAGLFLKNKPEMKQFAKNLPEKAEKQEKNLKKDDILIEKEKSITNDAIILQKSKKEKNLPKNATNEKFSEEFQEKTQKKCKNEETKSTMHQEPRKTLQKPDKALIKPAETSEKITKTEAIPEKSLGKTLDNFDKFIEEFEENLLNPQGAESKALPEDEAIEKIRFFNQTNESRLTLNQGSRERLLQAEAISMQRDVQNSLKILQNNLDFDPFPKKSVADFSTIPILPKGRELTLKLLETWGDEHYIGLTGVEIFSETGKTLQISLKNIQADPPDINILQGYGKDPRTIDKIVDGVYFTCDDVHMWLAPFSKGKDHLIQIDLGEEQRISAIRIWNYNKSRIHSFRGVKKLAISLDNRMIFHGQIKKANGTLENCHENCEYILFTTEEKIINSLEKNDWLSQFSLKNLQEAEKENYSGERPNTGTRDSLELEGILNEKIGCDGRPLTSVSRKPLVNKVFGEEARGASQNQSLFEVMGNLFINKTFVLE